MRRKKPYGVFVHARGFTVNGLARLIGVNPRTLREFFRGDWKRLGEKRRSEVQVALGLPTITALEKKVFQEWAT